MLEAVMNLNFWIIMVIK